MASQNLTCVITWGVLTIQHFLDVRKKLEGESTSISMLISLLPNLYHVVSIFAFKGLLFSNWFFCQLLFEAEGRQFNRQVQGHCFTNYLSSYGGNSPVASANVKSERSLYRVQCSNDIVISIDIGR